jgi:hypothetical protein
MKQSGIKLGTHEEHAGASGGCSDEWDHQSPENSH